MTNNAKPELRSHLQELARELGRPAQALYLFLASWSLAKSACHVALHPVNRSQRIPHNSTALADNSLAVPESLSVAADNFLAVPKSLSVPADSCCLPRASSVSRAVTGQQQAEACSKQLTELMQDFPAHMGLQFLQQHQQQRHHKHQQHHHHSYFDDPKRLLLFGRSLFALYPSEPSKEVWLSLMQHMLAHDELPSMEKPHDLLLPRSSSGLPMQPRWVARRVSIQQV